MNVVRLNNYLSNNIDAIQIILEKLNCDNIKYIHSRNEFRCSRESGKNPTAVRINCETLRFICYSTNEQGSVYNLVMLKKNFSFPEALRWVAKSLGLNSGNLADKMALPFGGFYKNILHTITEPELHMTTYPEETLDVYGHNLNLSFLKDGIDFQTQEKFQIGYDHETDRITIPQWSVNGELVGVMGRSNDIDIPHEYRWLPIIPCSRSYTLFGYHQNYQAIQQQQLVVITESEKGVMQMSSMGYDFGLATCTKTISDTQARYIKALRVEKIILAYDQGVPENDLIKEAQKVMVNNAIYNNKVGYIYDPQGNILTLDKKESPTDKNIKEFQTLVNKYTKWIGELPK